MANWVIVLASREFMQIVFFLLKWSKYGGNVKISLITVSHMASCKLRNFGQPDFVNYVGMH